MSDVSFLPDPPELPSSTSTPDAVLDCALLGWMQHTGPLTTQELSNWRVIDQDDNRSEYPATIDPTVTSASATSTHKVNPCRISLAALDAAILRLEATGAILRGHFRSTSGVIEWCDRRLLARIHRLTVRTLSKQIEPVTVAQFMHWLLRWQHLAPATVCAASTDCSKFCANCRALKSPPALGSATSSPTASPPTTVPRSFFLREECEWMHPRARDDSPEPGLSASVQLVLDALRRRGASFFADLLRITALDRLEVERGLWELVAAGFVTADAFDNLRGLISKARPAPFNSRGKRPRHTAGRWSVLWNANDDAGDAADRTAKNPNESAPSSPEHIEATCWMLLRRYGIVFREVIARESNLPKWRELQLAFRRLEDRGQVRGGRFVSGFVGEQFALPVAVESVREVRNVPASNELITISAAHPLNLVGILVPGERIPPSARALYASARAPMFPTPTRGQLQSSPTKIPMPPAPDMKPQCSCFPSSFLARTNQRSRLRPRNSPRPIRVPTDAAIDAAIILPEENLLRSSKHAG